jgi:hypothetical protein
LSFPLGLTMMPVLALFAAEALKEAEEILRRKEG